MANGLERIAALLRRSGLLARAPALRRRLRPIYELALRAAYRRRGLPRLLNGTEAIRLDPAYRSVPESYEPEWWHRIVGETRSQDHVVDVGANVGVLTVAFARRAPEGRVTAFEPDPANAAALRRHLALNGIATPVRVVELAIGASEGVLPFAASGSQLSSPVGRPTTSVPATTLDAAFPDERVDLLKIDVEGWEHEVLRGARRLLADAARRPRAVFVEVHPTELGAAGSSPEDVRSALRDAEYSVEEVPMHEGAFNAYWIATGSGT